MCIMAKKQKLNKNSISLYRNGFEPSQEKRKFEGFRGFGDENLFHSF